MNPWATEQMYLNFAETRRDPRTLWTDQAYHRLRRIKNTVDPTNLIRSNHPIASLAGAAIDPAPVMRPQRSPLRRDSGAPEREER